MRIVCALLCLITSAAAVAGERPLVCTGFGDSPKVQPPVEDLATGKLPLPDYQDTFFACAKVTGRVPADALTAAGAERVSPWLDSERARYVSVLARQPADVLVVPVQVQSYGLDRIERAVMTADLAYAIGDAGSLRVADPFLTALALGEGRRRIDQRAVEELAQKIGARKILFSYVGHDLQHAFTLTLELKGVGTGATGNLWRRDWRSIPFTNERTPAYVLHEMLPAVVKEIPLGLAPKPVMPAQAAASPSRITGTPLTLVSAGSKSVPDLAAMSLLAALAPRNADLARERLFQRALVAALRANSSRPAQRFLESHALFYLHRRPGALARINGATGPSFDALRALLDGNLPGAQKATKAVKNPFEQLLLQFLVRDLEYQYEVEEPTKPTAAAILFAGEAADAWAPLLLARAEDRNRWFTSDAATIKEAFDAAFPIKEFELESLIRGTSVVRGVPPGMAEIDLANIRHAHRLASTLDPAPCCQTHDLKPNPRDLLWLLEGSAEERINRDVLGKIFKLGDLAGGLQSLATYESLLKGHPRMTALSAAAAEEMAMQSPDDTRANWARRALDEARIAVRSAPGQNLVSNDAAIRLGVPSPEREIWVDVYGYDFPRRPYWSFGFVALYTQTPPGQARMLAVVSEAHAFSSSDVNPLGQFDEKERREALASLGSRFKGHPDRPVPEPAKPTPAPATAEDRIAAARAAAKADPDQYLMLGYETLYSERPLKEARDAFMQHPQFRAGSARDRVALSNHTYEIGSIFYWLGHGDLAKPLLQIAADLDTGSDASIAALQRLQVLSGDYRGAAQSAQRRVQRYPSPYSQRDYLSLLHVLGEGEAAWSAFSQLQTADADPALWASALVGHRMEKMDERALRAWLRTPSIRDAKVKAQRFASHYALLWSSTDRTPPADLAAFIEELEGKPEATVKNGGVVRPSSIEPEGFEFVPQTFMPEGVTRPPDGTLIRSERVYFADAYSSLIRGDNAGAVERFRAMLAFYQGEGSVMPYLAYASSKTGDPLKFEAHVARPRPYDYRRFDLLLARAFFAAGRKEVDEAYRLLNLAFRVKPYVGDPPQLVSAHYQFAQACEWLYRDTKDPRFAATLLDWARGYQSIQPTVAWGYALQYQYEKDPEARQRALAMTLYLDPLSERIQSAPKAEIDAARSWLAKNNPFLMKGPAEEDGNPKRRTVAVASTRH